MQVMGLQLRPAQWIWQLQKGILSETGFPSCARHVYRVDGLKETLSPNQREDNQQARVPLATVGWAYGKPHQNALVTMGGMWNS